MSINPISPMLLEQTTPHEMTKPASSSFTHWLGNELVTTNNTLNNADRALTDLASGHAQQLHQTMLTLEEAKLSFQYLEQIRNRLLNAWQELLREQI